MNIISWEFLTLVILTFAVFMVLLGVFAAYFGKGKNRAYGLIIAVVGLIIAIVYGYMIYDGPITVIKNLVAWDIIYEAIVNILAVAIGALVAVVIFLVAVLKN